MTEKRFKAIDENIWQGNEIWCVAGGKHCADVIATAMNEIINENELLKKEIAHLKNRLAYKDQHSNEKFRGIEEWARGGF